MCLDYPCNLSRRDIRALLDRDSRTWIVTDATLQDHDIQDIVNCSQEGDAISLQMTERIRPQSRIVIPWQLTIGQLADEQGTRDTSDLKTSITCPPNDGLFLIQSDFLSHSFHV